MRYAALILAGLILWGASPARGQSGTSAANVTIQLPNFSTFGVNTTVLVPDSGPSPYAAQRQAFYSRVMYGRMNPQRATAAQRSAAIASVTAQVHDQRQADETILQAVRSRRANWVRGSTPARSARVPQAADPQLLSVAEIERRQRRQSAAGNREAAQLLEKARQAQDAGKTSVAAIYYDMAARRATGELAEQIERESGKVRTATKRPAAH